MIRREEIVMERLLFTNTDRGKREKQTRISKQLSLFYFLLKLCRLALANTISAPFPLYDNYYNKRIINKNQKKSVSFVIIFQLSLERNKLIILLD